MARIRGRTREQTHELAMQAAARAFAEFGYEGTSLARIADLAGITPATLCHHFGSKQGLYDAVVDAIYTDILGMTRQLDASQNLSEIIETSYAFLRARRSSLRLLMRNIVDSGGVTSRVRTVYMEPQLATMSAAVAARFDVSPRAARRAVVVMTHLLMRFITNSDDDNRVAFGVDDDATARQEITATLIGVAHHLLEIEAPSTGR